METNRITGTRDEHYDLISLLYHTLQSAETCEQYCRDAQRAHDPELATFFRQVQSDQRKIANDARRHLATRLTQTIPIL